MDASATIWTTSRKTNPQRNLPLLGAILNKVLRVTVEVRDHGAAFAFQNLSNQHAPIQNHIIRRTAQVHGKSPKEITMSGNIQEGSVVVLKSGSPPMTVTSVGDMLGTHTAWCSWFDGAKKMNSTFPVSSLEIDG